MKIEIGGVNHSLTFNMGMLRLLSKEYGIDPLKFDDLSTEKMVDLVYSIAYCAVVATCKIEKKEAPSKEVIEEAVDNLHPSMMLQIVNWLTSSMTTPKEIVEASQGGGEQQETFHVE